MDGGIGHNSDPLLYLKELADEHKTQIDNLDKVKRNLKKARDEARKSRINMRAKVSSLTVEFEDTRLQIAISLAKTKEQFRENLFSDLEKMTWKKFCKVTFNYSESRANKLVAIGSSPDPKAALQASRKKQADQTGAHRQRVSANRSEAFGMVQTYVAKKHPLDRETVIAILKLSKSDQKALLAEMETSG